VAAADVLAPRPTRRPGLAPGCQRPRRGRVRTRLLTPDNRLEHTGLPVVDGLIDAERAAAHGYLVVAEDLARVNHENARTALLFLHS
jgi:hypothetical protein